MAYQILLVEDDVQIREVITDYFQKGEQYQVTACADGEEGLAAFFEREFDMVLLDVMLPDMDGFSICYQMRQDSQVPIIFLTARGLEEDRLYGYQLGCDDYIVKPFSLPELYAKVQVLLKRVKNLSAEQEMVCGEIRLDPIRFRVTVVGQLVELEPKEYALLYLFMNHVGEVLDRDFILIKVWGYDFEGNDRVLDNQVKKLRKKLDVARGQLKTVFKKGYCLREKQ